MVLPEPGLETRLTTNTPAARNCSRSDRDVRSFCFRMFFLTSTKRGCAPILVSPMPQLRFLSLHDLRSGSAAFSATNQLNGTDPALRLAAWTKNYNGNLF